MAATVGAPRLEVAPSTRSSWQSVAACRISIAAAPCSSPSGRNRFPISPDSNTNRARMRLPPALSRVAIGPDTEAGSTARIRPSRFSSGSDAESRCSRSVAFPSSRWAAPPLRASRRPARHQWAWTEAGSRAALAPVRPQAGSRRREARAALPDAARVAPAAVSPSAKAASMSTSAYRERAAAAWARQ